MGLGADGVSRTTEPFSIGCNYLELESDSDWRSVRDWRWRHVER